MELVHIQRYSITREYSKCHLDQKRKILYCLLDMERWREYILVGLMRALTQGVIGRWCVHKDMNCQVKG